MAVTPNQTPPSRFARAIADFDAANREDPNRECVGDVDRPKELVYAERMTACLERVAPDAPEPVRLAARSQHIRRWTIPRRQYPQGREGYRRWRTDLGRFHAETAGDILRAVGYDEATTRRVQTLLRMERLEADPDVQLLEDVICLVFLQHYLADFAGQHERQKVVDIIRKTWSKMSDRGRDAALALDLPPHVRALMRKAVETPDG